jgi:hypothetical protein
MFSEDVQLALTSMTPENCLSRKTTTARTLAADIYTLSIDCPNFLQTALEYAWHFAYQPRELNIS